MRGHHDETMPVEHLSTALDLTAYIGRGTIRMEAGGEQIDDLWDARGFLAVEYQLLPKLTLIGSGNLLTVKRDVQGTAFAGVATKLKSVTIRGGYEYGHTEEESHTVVLQLNRQFSFSR